MNVPIEVWLTQRNISVRCMIVNEDESVDMELIRSLNIRGAQREITNRLAGQGFVPAGRWTFQVEGGAETMRLFRSGGGA